MIKRSTLIVVLVFIILAAAAWYLQSIPGLTVQGTATPTRIPKLLSDWQEEKINQIEFFGENKTHITLKLKEANAWVISSQNDLPADNGKMSELTSSLQALTPLSLLDLSLNLETAGLSVEKNKLIMRTESGKEKTIYIGNATPTGGGYYARIDKNPPVVLSKYGWEDLAKILTVEGVMYKTPTPTVATPTEGFNDAITPAPVKVTPTIIVGNTSTSIPATPEQTATAVSTTPVVVNTPDIATRTAPSQTNTPEPTKS